MNEQKRAVIRKKLMNMVENGDGELALSVLRKVLVSIPRANAVTDVLVGVIDGDIPSDQEVVDRHVADNALDAFNDGKIDKSVAQRMCRIGKEKI